MATKISIDHALQIVKNNDHHKLIDVFNVLAKISSQYKEDETQRDFFIIFSHTDSLYHLSKIIKKEAPYIKSRTTITNCLKTLINMNILYYSYGVNGWVIRGMDNMLTEGYIELRKIFFTDIFYNMNITEKKALFYSVYIMSTKGYKSLKQIIINVKNIDSEWMQIFKSDNIYYIRERVQNILNRFFKDISDIKREQELEKLEDYIGEEQINKAKKDLKFKFFFIPNKIINEKLATKKTDREELQNFRKSDSSFYSYLIKLRERQDEHIQKKFTDRIMIALLRYCKGLNYLYKQEIASRILTKLFDTKEISSPDRYIGTVVQAYLQAL
ncbi:hypothetical protein [Alkaliphilus sp. B6464]|uniref:hypothetical protein n=1 Tax=Alkaliphilus sp. B6464 TaxID=2731219 RepID=UPI001BA9885C|nr:hypothetical protein [Alkaliphilus sp. B6464]QUH22070.1 hypothetical protein HYG84_19380 [Alkaliphilus sp. B6464]